MGNKIKDAQKLANELIVVSLVMVGLLLVWDATTRITEFNDRQGQLAKQSAKAASSELKTYISGYQRAVDIFAQENRFFLSNVELWPGDMALYSELKEKVDRFFPDNLSFTLADENGVTLLEGYEGLVGPACKRDIQQFAVVEGRHHTYRHQTSAGEFSHFDIMTNWEGGNSSDEIFFLSIKTDRIKEILSHADVLGHCLMLVSSSDLDYVEVIPDENVNVLSTPGQLSPAEMRRISYTLPIENTRWNVAILPVNSLYSEAHRNILVRSILIFIGFIVVSAIMRMILLDSDR